MAKQFSDRYDSRKWKGLRIAKVLAVIAVVLFLLFHVVLGFSRVDGVSMCNTLKDGDYVLYTRIFSSVQKGDIVSLSLPSGEYYVKRVVATAGDTVDIREGKLYINGAEETAPYVLGDTLSESETLSYPYHVEEGHVFVLGDNRPESVDSRYFGAVSEKHLTGLMLLRMGLFYLSGL